MAVAQDESDTTVSDKYTYLRSARWLPVIVIVGVGFYYFSCPGVGVFARQGQWQEFHHMKHACARAELADTRSVQSDHAEHGVDQLQQAMKWSCKNRKHHHDLTDLGK